MGRLKLRIKSRRRIIALLVLIGLVALVAYQFAPPPAPPDYPPGYQALKAAWLGVTWSMDAHSDSDIEALAKELAAHHLSYVFVYVSYLKSDGSFNPTYSHAQEFTRRLHNLMPDLHLLGWLGVPTQIDPAQDRLGDAGIREKIADFSGRIVSEMGFDGIHLDAEPIADHSGYFTMTLDAVRAAVPRNRLLSVAVPPLRLRESVTVIPYPSLGLWTEDFLRVVAFEFDIGQIVLMAYDSGLTFPTDYRSWMAYQVRRSASAVMGSKASLLIGVPTSEEWTLSHQVAENLTNALYGWRLGLSQTPYSSVLDGLAVYPEWETSTDEWTQIDAIPDAF
jgi:hypothetical protein